MSTFFLALFGIAGVMLVGTAVLSRVTAFQRWQAERSLGGVGLGIPPELDAVVRSRMAGRLLASSIGGLVGLAIGVVAYLELESADTVVAAYLTFAVTAVGIGAGTAVASLRAEGRHDDRPRIARSEAVGLSDYVVGLLRILAWGLVALAVATLAVSSTAVSPRDERVHFAGLALAVVGVVGLAGFEVVARRIVGRGHPSVSTDELVWNDALTASALGDILTAPVQAVALGSWYSILWSGSGSGAGASSGAGDPSPLALGLGVGVLVVAVAFGFVFRSTRTWYLAQLWPGARRRTPAEEAARVAAGAPAAEAARMAAAEAARAAAGVRP